MNMNMEHCWKDNQHVKTEELKTKSIRAILSTTNPTFTVLEMNQTLRSEKQYNNMYINQQYAQNSCD